MPTNALTEWRSDSVRRRMAGTEAANSTDPSAPGMSGMDAAMFALNPLARAAPGLTAGALATFLGMGSLNEAEAQSRGRGAQIDPADAAAAAKLPEHLRPQYLDLASRNRQGGLNRAERAQFGEMNRILSESEIASQRAMAEKGAATGLLQQQQRAAEADAQRQQYAADLTRAEEARQKVMANAPKTFQERFGDAASYAPIAPLAMAFGTTLPFTVRNALGKSSAAGQWRASTAAGLAATDAPTMQLNNQLAQSFAQKFPEQNLRNALSPYAVPAGIGAVEGAAIANIPDEWNASLPPANPEREAYIAALKELPPGHPARARFEQVLTTLPTTNPARDASLKYFGDPSQVVAKTGVGALQGAGGGALAASAGKWFAPSEAGLPRAQTRALAGRVRGDDAEAALRAIEQEAQAMHHVVPLPPERQRLPARPMPQRPASEAYSPPADPVAPLQTGYDPLAIAADRFDAEVAAIKKLMGN